jgi:hypothetical protein
MTRVAGVGIEVPRSRFWSSSHMVNSKLRMGEAVIVDREMKMIQSRPWVARIV